MNNIPERLLLNLSSPEWRKKIEEEYYILNFGFLYDFGNNYNYNNYNYNYNYNSNNYNYNYNNNNNYNSNNNNNNNSNYYNNYNSNNYNYNYNSNNYNNRGKKMPEDQLIAIACPFGYTITWLVGKLTRLQGDEYSIKGKRVLSLGNKTHEDILEQGTTELSKPFTRGIHRLQVVGWQLLDEKVWKDLLK